MEWEAPHSLGRPCPVPKLQEVSPQPSASGALSLAFCPCIDLAEGAGTWRAAILEHKAMFMSGLPGTHGWTPKVRYAPGNRSGCVCACGCVLSLEAEAYSSQL